MGRDLFSVGYMRSKYLIVVSLSGWDRVGRIGLVGGRGVFCLFFFRDSCI